MHIGRFFYCFALFSSFSQKNLLTISLMFHKTHRFSHCSIFHWRIRPRHAIMTFSDSSKIFFHWIQQHSCRTLSGEWEKRSEKIILPRSWMDAGFITANALGKEWAFLHFILFDSVSLELNHVEIWLLVIFILEARKLGMRDLIKKGKIASDARKIYRKLLSLPLLPQELFHEGYKVIKREAVDGNLFDAFKKLFAYYDRTWVAEVSWKKSDHSSQIYSIS